MSSSDAAITAVIATSCIGFIFTLIIGIGAYNNGFRDGQREVQSKVDENKRLAQLIINLKKLLEE